MFKVQQNTELSFSKHNPLLPQSLNSTQLEETVEGSLYDYPDTNGSLFIKIDQDRINDIRSEHEPWAQNTNLEISAIFGTLNLSLNGIN